MAALNALGLLIVGAASFCAVSALLVLVPSLVSGWGRAVLIVAAAAAAGGAAAGEAPTGLVALDAALAGALAGGLTLAGARAHPAAVVAGTVVVAAAAVGGEAAWTAFAGVGVACAGLATGIQRRRPVGPGSRDCPRPERGTVRAPLVGAASAALVAQAALRLHHDAAGMSAAITAVVVTVVVASALAASPPGARRRLLLGSAGMVAFAGVATVAFGAAALGARRPLEQAALAARTGFDAARAGNTEAAVPQLHAAAGAFSEARDRLNVWWAQPARVVPAVARNALALEQVATSGGELARLATTAASEADPRAVRIQGGNVDLAAVEDLRQPLARMAGALATAQADLADARSPWLAPPLRGALDDLHARVSEAAPAAADAAAVAELVPDLLGRHGPRRYFLALLTPVELRGSGGLLGNFGELTANDGRLELVRTGRATDLNAGGAPELSAFEGRPGYLDRFERRGRRVLWQDITLSPHFPTVASAIETLYPRSGGAPVDGVISLDPLALAAVLQLTGPVRIPEWPEPIGAANAADVLLREQYLRLGTEDFTNPDRVHFLDSLLRAVFHQVTASELPPPSKVAEVLGPLVRRGSLQFHSTTPHEQGVFERLGAAGALAPVVGDYAALVTNNSGGNKIDLFLERSLSYRVAYDPATGATSATAEIRLDNRAPPEGLPSYVIGSGGPVAVPSGTNRLYLSFYSALRLEGATIEGRPLPMEAQREQDRHVYSAFVTIPPGEARTIALELSGDLATGRTYRLDLGHQSTIEPDTVKVHLDPPPGWRVSEANRSDGTGEASTAGLGLVLDHDQWATFTFTSR